ncbi:GumC family protein [Paraburkholderia sp. EG287B]|uniref:GumC family protein n=1 Tax=Paraburkholderia sp. EG287B TaxID=3237010 RepID=UPI0034D24E92
MAVALLVPMPYRAQSTLLVLLAGYYDQSNNPNGGAAVQPAIGQLDGVEAQILSSPELHRDVVIAKLGPNASEHEIDSHLQEFEHRLHIEQNDLASTINLTYYDADPKEAADGLSRLLDTYFRRRATIFTSGRVDFLTGQRDEVARQLKKADADLLAFQKTHGIVNIDDQTSRAVLLESQLVQQKLENDTSLAQHRGELKSEQASSKGVKATIPIFTDDSEAAHALDTMQLSLMQLEARRADFASRYMDSSPFVQQLDQQIADMHASIARRKAQMATATRYGHNDYYDVVQGRLAALNASIAGETARQQALEDQIKDTRATLRNLSDISSQLRQLQATRDILADSFKDRSRQVELAKIQQGQVSQVNSTNVRVIQAPFPPSQRSVSASLIIAASVAAGLLIAALVVLVMASLRETFLSPEQAERSLLLPVLNAPVMLGGGGARRPGAAGASADAGKAASRPAHMAYGRMIAAINASTDSPAKVVMALSFGKNDGLLSVIRGLAVELEHRTTKPVLILDMASGADAPLYGPPNAQGLLTWSGHGGQSRAASAAPTEIAASGGLVFESVERHNIVVARPESGTFPASWQQTTTLFDALREAHDYIVVHAPPASQSFAGIENAALADATVMAVRAEVSRKPVVLGLKTQLLDAGGRLIGIALTHRRGYIPNFIYRFF